MLLGGKVRGKQIKGNYPEDLAEGTSPWILTRGKVIPTTSWDSIWHGLAEWFGVPASQMASVLPNKDAFGKDGVSPMFSANDLFHP